MSLKRPLFRFAIVPGTVVLAALAAFEAVFLFGPEQLVARFDSPERIGLKAANLTANLNGKRGFYGRLYNDTRFRANKHDWRRFVDDSPRLDADGILLELPAGELVSGENVVDVVFQSFTGLKRHMQVAFRYEPKPASLPFSRDWSRDTVEVQDGYWERVETEAGWRLRPSSGTEGYDRLALLSPPFKGSRRVTIEVTFERSTGRLFGFGVIPFWGGHNDPEPVSPRRGWEYGIAWYYAPKKGFGVEFSQKDGAAPHRTVNNYQRAPVAAGETYRIVAEALYPSTSASTVGGYSLRMQWEHPESGHVSDWLELSDSGAPLSGGPYAVALVAHRAAVQFGPVVVERLDPE